MDTLDDVSVNRKSRSSVWMHRGDNKVKKLLKIHVRKSRLDTITRCRYYGPTSRHSTKLELSGLERTVIKRRSIHGVLLRVFVVILKTHWSKATEEN